MSTHNIGFYEEKKKECKDQELKQSEPKSSPQNQNKEITKITNSENTKRHMVTGLSSYFPKGGHSAAQTEQKIIRTQARRNITETRHQKQATEKHNKTTPLEFSVI